MRLIVLFFLIPWTLFASEVASEDSMIFRCDVFSQDVAAIRVAANEVISFSVVRLDQSGRFEVNGKGGLDSSIYLESDDYRLVVSADVITRGELGLSYYEKDREVVLQTFVKISDMVKGSVAVLNIYLPPTHQKEISIATSDLDLSGDGDVSKYLISVTDIILKRSGATTLPESFGGKREGFNVECRLQ